MKRVLALGTAGLLCLALLLLVLGYGFMHGWHLARVPAAQISAQLRPWDEVVTPEGPGPFPTAILFHGCGGKRASLGEWAQRFREAGFASVIVDSFAGRGLDAAAVCGGRRLLPAERAGDVLVSLGDVRGLPFVDPQRIVLMGWSHGSVAIMDLLVMAPPNELPPNLEREGAGSGSAARGNGQNLDGVAGVVLFYPYCGIGSRSYHGAWAWPAPSLFLLGGVDTRAPSGACFEVASALEAEGRPVEARVYPQAGHGFDHREHAPGSATGYDPAASADAGERVRALLLSVARAAPRQRRSRGISRRSRDPGERAPAHRAATAGRRPPRGSRALAAAH